MTIAGRRTVRIWVGLLLATVLALYLVSDVLFPFAVGLVVAYILSPFVDRLARYGVPRWLGTLVVGGVFILAAVAAVLVVVPPLVDQSVALVARMPEIAEALRNRLVIVGDAVRERLGPDQAAEMESFITQHLGTVATWAAGMLGGIVGSGLAIFNAISLVFITPIVGFYLLRDWHHIMAALDANVPKCHAADVHELAIEVDLRLAGFLRGQGVVCLSLGAFYAIGLSLVGLDFALAIGIFSGLVSFIPFVGSISGLVLSLSVALVQFPDWTSVIIVAAVFFAGQAIEGNVLTPLLVGDRVGLHPVWVIFALLAGGAVFGFVGLLLAVPAAAVLGVLVRFTLERYRASTLFNGQPDA
ncbi:putative PurR-regulated permease PerM [Stella humosa]|uniref:Putative PurR-regulated permease PerM n=1 Tax=Stella humosa TaxID=94 RepID=A0A3N1M704_9PROT|nr:AI-2E family transporter [Stella humosa]ROP99502.1 putative PurR-regulated permease PerM [Stella humosa]BBK31284.1 AI-2E family transporter [Stella humosa]